MKKSIFLLILFGGTCALVVLWSSFGNVLREQIAPSSSVSGVVLQEEAPLQSTAPAEVSPEALPDKREFVPPLPRASERVTKKPFGIFITPKTSPIQPERFRGYHTGTDFETFPEEASVDVPVSAICAGTLAEKRSASGYGGVVVENCTVKNEPVTVIYGHMRLSSVEKVSGEKLSAGENIGVLGTGFSEETDGERKHLHLGIHKGIALDIRGYVPSTTLLSEWEDPCFFVCRGL